MDVFHFLLALFFLIRICAVNCTCVGPRPRGTQLWGCKDSNSKLVVNQWGDLKVRIRQFWPIMLTRYKCGHSFDKKLKLLMKWQRGFIWWEIVRNWLWISYRKMMRRGDVWWKGVETRGSVGESKLKKNGVNEVSIPIAIYSEAPPVEGWNSEGKKTCLQILVKRGVVGLENT